MTINRLRKRLSSVAFNSIGYISGHVLKFDKVSSDGSGKANIRHTDNNEDVVHGVVFEIKEVDKNKLDEIEKGYCPETIKVTTSRGKIEAFTYYAEKNKINDSLKPYAWYMIYVINGAIKYNLPKEYILKLEAFNTIKDRSSEKYDT